MKISKSILLVLVFFFISSCYKNFRYNINNENKVNISCFLRANDTIRVYVNYLLDVYDFINNDNKYIDNAEIYIYKEGILKDKLEYSNTNYSEGWYVSKNFIPVENANYQLKVIVPGFDTIFAQTNIPVSVKIDTVRSLLTTTIDYSGYETFVLNHSIVFTDISNQKNYYCFNIYNYYNTTHYKSYDPVIEDKNLGNYYSFITEKPDNIPYFSDTLFSNSSYSLSVSNSLGNFYSDTMIFYDEFFSLSKDAYLFYKSSYLQYSTRENPLSEPVVIYSNIKNGTGIFAGMSSDVDSIILIKN